MTQSFPVKLRGHAGSLHGVTWPNDEPRYVAVLSHGYGEHLGRYRHVVDALHDHGAMVAGLDHAGHGRSDGEPVSIEDFEHAVDDLQKLLEYVHAGRADLPVVLIGHSMGGMIAARYAQRHGDELTALVLTGPVIGRWETAEQLLAEDEIPDTAIDPETLSRDPKVREAYEEDELVYRGPFQRETLEALQACLRRIHEEGSIELPTLWIHGEQDELVPVGPSREGVRELVPEEHRTEDVRSGARHEVFNEIDHDAVLDEVTEFIDRHIG